MSESLCEICLEDEGSLGLKALTFAYIRAQADLPVNVSRAAHSWVKLYLQQTLSHTATLTFFQIKLTDLSIVTSPSLPQGLILIPLIKSRS